MYFHKSKFIKQDEEDPCAVYIPEEHSKEEVGYYRKFNALHGWLENEYRNNGGTEKFNCVRINITLDILKKLKKVVKNKELIPTEGFFFGDQNPVTKEQYKNLKKFIKYCKQEIKDGWYITYTSWW